MIDLIKEELIEHFSLAEGMANLVNEIDKVSQICIDSLKRGNKIILFGNGGSAADSQHIAAEIVGRFKKERSSLPSIALTTDSSILTAIANDYGFDSIFSRQIEAICKSGDVVIGISTSGNSRNVLLGLERASGIGCHCIGRSGNVWGEMNQLCERNIIVPSNETARIQEMHILIGHIICSQIDKSFN